MTALVACPNCEGIKINLRTEIINLDTGKRIQVVFLEYMAILVGGVFAIFGLWITITSWIDYGYITNLYPAIVGLMLGSSLMGWGYNQLALRKGKKAKAFYYHCKDCKYDWKEWEEGVKVTRKMMQEWLIKDIETQKGYMRRDAILTLGDLGDENVLDPLLGILRDARLLNLSDRIAASKALGKIGDPGATEDLIQVLEDNNLAETAAQSLGMIGDPRALEPLERAATHKNKRVRTAAQKAIDQIKKSQPEMVV